MTWPVPEKYSLSTPYGKRGSYWSCQQNAQGQGIHTGADFAAPAGDALPPQWWHTAAYQHMEWSTSNAIPTTLPGTVVTPAPTGTEEPQP